MSNIALDLLGHPTRKDGPAMRQLTSLDAQFLALEDDRTQGHVSALATYDPETADGRKLDAALVRELVTERLHLLPTFRWRLVQVPLGLDHPYWVDDPSVEVDYHVRELALPSPGDDRQLAEQVARIAARPLDRSHPLWEMYVIHGLQDGAVALFTKMHHAAVDGASGAEVMGVLLDETTGGHVLSVRDRPAVERHPSRREMLRRGLTGVSRYPLRAVRAAPRTLRHLDAIPTIRPVPGVKAVARTSRLINRMIPGTNDCAAPARSDLTAPRTRFQARISRHRRVAFGSLSLDEVKEVKNTYGCTVNDVVMAMCATALRGWLSERGELPDQPLVGWVPMSVRTPDEIGTYGNRVSVMLAELPTDEADPLRRLRRVSQSMRSAKEHYRALPPSLIQDANDLIPPALFPPVARGLMRLMGMRGVQPPVNIAISNVPGSPRPLYCAGALQRSQYPISGVLDGLGLNITVFSYRDKLEFGIVGDRELIDDPWPIVEALGDALAELRELAQAVLRGRLADGELELIAAEPTAAEAAR